jgi:peptidyl-prolyl cis-trans isomerase A (cyclophilin A)
MRKQVSASIVTLLPVFLFICAQAHSQAPVAPPQPAPKSSGAAGQGASKKKPASTAAAARQFDRALLQPALLKAKALETYQVKMSTTKGDFVITVHRAWAPLGADRFYNLVRHHFYDQASFFRTMPGFMTQFGISAYPQVNAALRNATIKDDPVTQSNKRGFATFATGGPDTRTTQVFINLVDNSRLDSQGFAPFGEVTEGMAVVDQLYGGYGDGPPRGSGPDQDQIQRQGKPYLDQGWPKLDSIRTATLLTAAPAAASKPRATKKAPQ